MKLTHFVNSFYKPIFCPFFFTHSFSHNVIFLIHIPKPPSIKQSKYTKQIIVTPIHTIHHSSLQQKLKKKQKTLKTLFLVSCFKTSTNQNPKIHHYTKITPLISNYTCQNLCFKRFNLFNIVIIIEKTTKIKNQKIKNQKSKNQN